MSRFYGTIVVPHYRIPGSGGVIEDFSTVEPAIINIMPRNDGKTSISFIEYSGVMPNESVDNCRNKYNMVMPVDANKVYRIGHDWTGARYEIVEYWYYDDKYYGIVNFQIQTWNRHELFISAKWFHKNKFRGYDFQHESAIVMLDDKSIAEFERFIEKAKGNG